MKKRRRPINCWERANKIAETFFGHWGVSQSAAVEFAIGKAIRSAERAAVRRERAGR